MSFDPERVNDGPEVVGSNGEMAEPVSELEWANDSPEVVPSNGDLAETVPEAVAHLQSAVSSGVPWHRALLEAIGLWTLPLEVYQDREYRYLIRGEALDWLLLAERLCCQIDGAIPAEEKEKLLFYGTLPDEVSPEDFREWIGPTKYSAYLNYWYGVVVEEALQLIVEEEVRKRHRARGFPDSEDFSEEAFTHLYEATRTVLLEEFRLAAHIPARRHLSLFDLKEFTYWLFKRRIEMWDPARVASDTRRGIKRLELLEQLRETNLVSVPD